MAKMLISFQVPGQQIRFGLTHLTMVKTNARPWRGRHREKHGDLAPREDPAFRTPGRKQARCNTWPGSQSGWSYSCSG